MIDKVRTSRPPIVRILIPHHFRSGSYAKATKSKSHCMFDRFLKFLIKNVHHYLHSAYELYADPESDKPSAEVTNVGSTAKRKGSPGKGKTTIAAWFKKVFFRKKANVQAEPRSEETLPNVTNVGSGTKQQRSTEHQETTMAARFKKAFSHKEVHVHYVGVW